MGVRTTGGRSAESLRLHARGLSRRSTPWPTSSVSSPHAHSPPLRRSNPVQNSAPNICACASATRNSPADRPRSRCLTPTDRVIQRAGHTQPAHQLSHRHHPGNRGQRRVRSANPHPRRQTRYLPHRTGALPAITDWSFDKPKPARGSSVRVRGRPRRRGRDAAARRRRTQVTMPAQHSVGPHQQPQAIQAGPGQRAEQRGQPGPIGQLELDPLPAELAVQHRELVTYARISASLSRSQPGSSRSNANAFVIPRYASRRRWSAACGPVRRAHPGGCL